VQWVERASHSARQSGTLRSAAFADRAATGNTGLLLGTPTLCPRAEPRRRRRELDPPRRATAAFPRRRAVRGLARNLIHFLMAGPTGRPENVGLARSWVRKPQPRSTGDAAFGFSGRPTFTDAATRKTSAEYGKQLLSATPARLRPAGVAPLPWRSLALGAVRRPGRDQCNYLDSATWSRSTRVFSSALVARSARPTGGCVWWQARTTGEHACRRLHRLSSARPLGLSHHAVVTPDTNKEHWNEYPIRLSTWP